MVGADKVSIKLLELFNFFIFISLLIPVFCFPVVDGNSSLSECTFSTDKAFLKGALNVEIKCEVYIFINDLGGRVISRFVGKCTTLLSLYIYL